MTRLLLVDDDDFICSVMESGLVQLGYQVDIANDGWLAWNKLQSAPNRYDLVLLDKNMPRMDGITLLKQLKSDPGLAKLPVVMLTGDHHPEEVAEGLAAGAFYYLIKPAAPQILDAVIANALEDRRRKDELREIVSHQESSHGLIRRGEFVYRTLAEAKGLALLLASASQNASRTITGYSELLINAVEHGNLEIGYGEKSRLLTAGCWLEEIESRLASPQYAARRVEVALENSDQAFTVTITDQGQGFDWRRYLEFEPERAFDLHGRGIAMSKSFSFDCLEYWGKGNSVTATVLK